MINNMSKECCNENEIPETTVKLFLDNKVLWVTVNGVQAGINLSSLSTGGGGSSPSGTPTEILLPVTSNGQTLFSQVIPEDASATGIVINGVLYSQIAGDFDIDDTDVVWNGDDLNITDTVVLKLWQL